MECESDKLVLRYRYTLDELALLLQGVRARAESYEIWVDKVKEALESKGKIGCSIFLSPIPLPLKQTCNEVLFFKFGWTN